MLTFHRILRIDRPLAVHNTSMNAHMDVHVAKIHAAFTATLVRSWTGLSRSGPNWPTGLKHAATSRFILDIRVSTGYYRTWPIGSSCILSHTKRVGGLSAGYLGSRTGTQARRCHLAHRPCTTPRLSYSCSPPFSARSKGTPSPRGSIVSYPIIRCGDCAQTLSRHGYESRVPDLLLYMCDCHICRSSGKQVDDVKEYVNHHRL